MSTSPPTLPFFAPEVIQTSAMDCGPAALQSLLAGFGLRVGYDQLRQACGTDVDGTALNTLQDVAEQLGMETEQMLLPVDHLFLASITALPALMVTTLPNGLLHFVVVWRVWGGWVQVMDPARGRYWLKQQEFLQTIHRHTMPVTANDWLAWVREDGFQAPLRQRLSRLGVIEATCDRLLATVCSAPGWRTIAALDAAVRLVESMSQDRSARGGVQGGAEAAKLVEYFFAHAQQEPQKPIESIPTAFWLVQEDNRVIGEQGQPLEQEQEPHLLMNGCVLLHFCQRRAVTPSPQHPAAPAVVFSEPRPSPEGEIIGILRQDGWLVPSVLALSLAMAALGVTLEVAVLRGLFGLNQSLAQSLPRLDFASLDFVSILLSLALILLLLEAALTPLLLRMGRRIEVRLRLALLTKLPQLSDRYFHSRLTSDLTQRAHELRQLRSLPLLAANFLRTCWQLLFTVVGLIWLAPHTLWLALLISLAVVTLSLFTQPHLIERDMRVRSHASALSRFYLDALLGLTPARSHSAERAIRREHESMVVAWSQALGQFQQSATLIQLVIGLITVLGTVGIVVNTFGQSTESANLLLILYWAVSLPALAQALAGYSRQYPAQRNRLLRLLETLNAPSENDKPTAWQNATLLPNETLITPSPPHPLTPSPPHPFIQINNASLQVGSHAILQGVNLSVQAGEHVAIVGASGAGKSSLVGLLLGWQQATTGAVYVDGKVLEGAHLRTLRRETAWVDPGVQIWNRSLWENLRYGSAESETESLEQVLGAAELYDLIERLPNGLQTPLGENGGLVSGGEGQRVRIGRSLLRPDVRLVLLDEPMRGLARGQRHALLDKLRHHWQHATLFCITHDVAETLAFPRVVVLDNGRVIEDGTPRQLCDDPQSHYRRLLETEEAVQRNLWEAAPWRRFWLENGHLEER